MTTKLVFTPPGPDTPGYLKRVRQALKFQQNLSDNPTPQALDEMVEFLSQYVTEPQEHEAKLDALWMASQSEFNLLLTAVTGEAAGGDENPTSAARLNVGK